uniref:Uncharacterized protein n=1 Tax=Plectus sambesii TaxID=2011161 RepID=A0A914WGM9_9BILA
MPPQEPTRDGNQETFTVVEDETDEKQMSFTEAENEIEMCVRLDQSLDEVMANFFQGNSDRDLSRDKTFVELAYTSKLLEVFPSKAAVHVDGVISKHDSKEMGHWLETFDGDSVSSNSNDIFDLFQDEPFAQNLKDISKSNNSIDNDNIFQIVSAIFKEKFMASTNLPGELGIYRDITVCTHNTRLSSVFCDALQILWKCCISQDQEVDIKPEVEDVHIEHNLFARAVEEFVTNFKISGRHEAFEHGFIKKHIKSMFVPLTYRVFEEDGHHVLEVSGRKLVISALLPKIEEQFKDHPEISQIRFAAVRDICINENLTYPGICVSVLAPSVVIKGKVEWDLSGVNAAEQISLQEKAPSGKDEGEIGQDGKDGAAGGSSGNFALFTKEMLNAENFHIILNGGNGHKGQDGGDGANGADGYGEKFDEVFSSSTKVLMYFGSLSNTVTGGVVGRIAGGFERQRMNSGTINVGISSTYYLSTHFMEYYEGTEGQPGGKGGQNGCGGQGGKKGDVNFVNTSGGENFPVKVTAQDGNDGESGKPGKTGLHGKDGWDVGIMRKTMGGYLEYGKSHNEKFKIDMSKDYTDNSVYVPSLYNGSGSYCYAGIQPQKRQRKMLNDNEKYCEMKTDAERKGDAIACKSTAISMKALEEKFNAMSNTTQEQKMEVSASKETDAQLNR